MRYLFVCSGHADRSPTAKDVCKKMAEENGLELEVRSAGLEVDTGIGQLTRDIADWADRIFVMEQYMIEKLVDDYGQPLEKVVSLDIRDDIYEKNDPELKSILREKLGSLIFGGEKR